MRILLAFIITTIIYLLLIWFYISNLRDIMPPKKKYTQSVVKIDIINIPSPPPKQKKIVKKEKEIKKVVKIKKNIKKKIVKKKVKKEVKKEVNKKIIVPKKNFIPESEIIYIPNPIIQEEMALDNSIFDTQIEVKTDMSYPNRKVEKLYGKEFHSYTPSQKEFIEQNLDDIHRITQETLWRRGYPGGATSARTGQEGTNIVSFYLHPNGDISNLRLKKKVGYRVLDNNTIETIKSAYKDYPYPNEKTKMIFFVEYSIFGY